jgi:DNA-binding transcriptional regulator YiaG
MSSNDIQKLRTKLNLTQRELSEAFGLYDGFSISRWETGRRKPNEIIRRLFCLLNDLPTREADAFIKKLGQYKVKRR